MGRGKAKDSPANIWNRDSISRVFHDFFNSSITVENASQAVFTKGNHSQLDGLLPNDDGGRAFVNKGAQGVVNDEKFEDALSPFIASVVAIGATAAVIEDSVAQVVR